MQLLKSIVLPLVLIASIAIANPPTFDEVLDQCDIAVSELQLQVQSGDELVNLLRQQRNEAIKDSVNNEPGLPALLWILIGGAAGVLAMEFAR